MEGQDEVIGYSKDHTHMIMIKGKRTKRPRPCSPLALTMASTSSTTTTEDGTTSGVSDESGGFLGHLAAASSSSPGNSIEFTKIVQEEEEEDMANCLILLAQGQAQAHQQSLAPKGGLYVYECKTCNRSFPSFQALGGHRASHKRPKIDDKKPLTTTFPKIESTHDIISNNHPPITLSLQINPPNKTLFTTTTTAKNSKIHECSICGAEFTSGQALGGHMRRHRAMPSVGAISTTSATSNESQEMKKSRTLLSLDLNLPAPEDHDHHHEAKFPYASKEKMIAFSSSSLVDCHF